MDLLVDIMGSILKDIPNLKQVRLNERSYIVHHMWNPLAILHFILSHTFFPQ